MNNNEEMRMKQGLKEEKRILGVKFLYGSHLELRSFRCNSNIAMQRCDATNERVVDVKMYIRI